MCEQNKTSEKIFNFEQNNDFLNNISERIKVLYEYNIENESRFIQLLDKQTELKKQNDALEKEANKLMEEFLALEQKRKQYKNEANDAIDCSKIDENLENMYTLIGFYMTDFQIAENLAIITLNYNSHNFVKLTQNMGFKLMQIEPMPENFEKIKEFLEETQDVTGFLSALRTFFKFINQQMKI